MIDGIDPWTEDPSHPHYAAAVKATEHVYKIKPDFTREGGTIPVTLMLQEAVGKNILLLPVTAGDDGHHSQNEKIDMRNYIQGVRWHICINYYISVKIDS
jgi:nonspecific dipeptidase